MRIQAIIHADNEPLDTVGIWLLRNGYTIHVARPYAGERLSAIESFDALIVMGGPQCVYELDKYPYLINEIDLIQEAVKQHKSVLGICLGAQLIGAALGAIALKSPEKEVGIFPISLLSEAKSDPLFKEFPAQINVMHWHNDMAGLPKGAVVLAKSEGCPRQIIRFKKNVYGMQCHFEMSYDVAKNLIKHCPEDLAPSRLVQNKEQILAQDFSPFNSMLMTILDRFFSL